jgi:hypothetical protein
MPKTTRGRRSNSCNHSLLIDFKELPTNMAAGKKIKMILSFISVPFNTSKSVPMSNWAMTNL